MKGRMFGINNMQITSQISEKTENSFNQDTNRNYNDSQTKEETGQNEFSRDDMKKNFYNKGINPELSMNPKMYYNINNNLNLGFPNNNNFIPQQQFYPSNNFNQYNQFNQYPNKNYNNYNPKQTQIDENSLLESLKYVTEKYPHLIKLNQSYFGLTQNVKCQVNPRFFVIKSFTEEDIHKSIKYNVWSSTREGNKKLSNAYLENKKKNSEVYLFFSMNGSGRFVGIAKVASEVDESKIFEYWAMDDVWKGLFKVEWHIIKDIPNKYFKDIKLSNNAFKPVTNSRDTQEILRNEGEEMIRIFEEFKYQTNLLQHFQYYDERQDLFESTKQDNK